MNALFWVYVTKLEIQSLWLCSHRNARVIQRYIKLQRCFVCYWQLEVPDESRGPRNCARQWASSARQSPESVEKQLMHWWQSMSYSREHGDVSEFSPLLSATARPAQTASRTPTIHSAIHTHSISRARAQETSTRLTIAQRSASTSQMTSIKVSVKQLIIISRDQRLDATPNFDGS